MERKRKMLGELDNAQPKRFKYLVEHRNRSKECKFIQNLKRKV
jgi:hypothetical protein